MRVRNDYKVKELIYKTKAFVYCPLGNDWGHVEIEAVINPGNWIPNYDDVDQFIAKNVEGGKHITEEVGYIVYDYLKAELNPINLKVFVHSDNNSVHSCYTQIGE